MTKEPKKPGSPRLTPREDEPCLYEGDFDRSNPDQRIDFLRNDDEKKSLGIIIIRFDNPDVLGNREACAQKILLTTH